MTNHIDTGDKNTGVLHNAMHYGVILGLFWALKYLVFVGAGYWVHFIYLYYLLNVGTFFLMYVFYFKFRDLDPEQPKKKSECFRFMVALCFFASFFEAAMIYLHIQFFDPSYFSTKIQPVLTGIIESLPYSPDQKIAALNFSSSKILYVFSGFLGNIFLGAIFGGVMNLIAGNKKN